MIDKKFEDLKLDLSGLQESKCERLKYLFIKIIASEENSLILAQNLRDFGEIIEENQIMPTTSLVSFLEEYYKQLNKTKNEVIERQEEIISKAKKKVSIDK